MSVFGVGVTGGVTGGVVTGVNVLVVWTFTVWFFAEMVTVADGENDGAPNEYPAGADGGVSETVHCVPVGMPVIADDVVPAATDSEPSCAVPSLQS